MSWHPCRDVAVRGAFFFLPGTFLSTCIYSLHFSILYIFFWARSRDNFFILTAVSRPVSRPLHPISTCIYSLHFSILYIFRPVGVTHRSS